MMKVPPISKTSVIIEGMISEIQQHKRKKEDLLPMYVRERLDKQVQSYYSQILDSYKILSHQKDEVKLARKITK